MLRLASVLISPFGMMWTVPSMSRSTMVRRLICSTDPPMPLTRATSPTRTWSSSSRKKPEITSLTSVCAPKPTASPRMPAPVSTGVMSTSSVRRTISRAVIPITVLRKRLKREADGLGPLPPLDVRRSSARRRFSRCARAMMALTSRLAVSATIDDHADPQGGAGHPLAHLLALQFDRQVHVHEGEGRERQRDHRHHERPQANQAHRRLAQRMGQVRVSFDRCHEASDEAARDQGDGGGEDGGKGQRRQDLDGVVGEGGCARAPA